MNHLVFGDYIDAVVDSLDKMKSMQRYLGKETENKCERVWGAFKIKLSNIKFEEVKELDWFGRERNGEGDLFLSDISMFNFQLVLVFEKR